MAGESPISSLALLKENRIGLESDVPSSVIEFQIPSSTITFNRASRPTRRLLKKPPTYRNQEEFLNGSIASASSLYFSNPDRYPRSFLWRLLQDNKVLEIRSVDLSKSKEEEHEALYILRFPFPMFYPAGWYSSGRRRRAWHHRHFCTFDIKRAIHA